jgi:hypothetical protein
LRGLPKAAVQDVSVCRSHDAVLMFFIRYC